MSTPFYENFDPPAPFKNTEREEIAAGKQEFIGIQITDSKGSLTDPDVITAVVKVNPYGQNKKTIELDVFPQKESVGVYSFLMPAEAVQDVAEIDVLWNYFIGGEEYNLTEGFYIQQSTPFFNSLTDGQKQIVERITWMLGDLFDNARGGTPNFNEEWQTHFGKERIAQMMDVALSRLNSLTRGQTNYTLGGTGNFPAQWNAVLMWSTWVEVLRHFVRTYVEQPTVQGAGGIPMVDRRDYMQRWQTILQDAQKTANDAESSFIYGHLNLGGGALLVSGGNYPSVTPYYNGRAQARVYPRAIVW